MKRFVIITNNDKKKNIDSGNMIKDSLIKRGCKVTWLMMPISEETLDIPKDTEVILTIGGDGTMVRTAARTIGAGVPLIGFNKGHLGYLCDIKEEDINESLDLLVEGKFDTEKRMMLSGVFHEKRYNALNDIVINTGGAQIAMKLNIYVNNSFLYAFNGDGIIVATPTGSTAYNLSANGPIVEPNTQLMLLTPINPHTLNSRSIVLDSSDTIEIEIESRRSVMIDKPSVFFDGTKKGELSPREKLCITKAKESTRFIKLDTTSFVERMKTRLGE